MFEVRRPFLGNYFRGFEVRRCLLAAYFLRGSIFGVRYSFYIFPKYLCCRGSISGALSLVDIATLNFSAWNGVEIMSGDAQEAKL